MVPVLCSGAGVTGASLGVVDNTEPFGWMTSSFGMDGFENPFMTEALDFAALEVDRGGRFHWI